jgi:hypothetical protein
MVKPTVISTFAGGGGTPNYSLATINFQGGGAMSLSSISGSGLVVTATGNVSAGNNSLGFSNVGGFAGEISDSELDKP